MNGCGCGLTWGTIFAADTDKKIIQDNRNEIWNQDVQNTKQEC
jgi:hypothetical protein